MAASTGHGEPVDLRVAGSTVTITSPDKVMFPRRGETKLDLARYYLAVDDALMNATRDRPVLLERYPNGVGGTSFYQKRIPDSAPDWLTTTTVMTINGTPSRALVIADIAHVLWAANMGCLGLHVWPFRASATEDLEAFDPDEMGAFGPDDVAAFVPDDTDELRIDLDPSPGVTFDMVRETAAHVRAFLDEEAIRAYVKTTGSRGLHVYVRVEPGWDGFDVRRAAVSVARELEHRLPDLVTASWWKEERGRRVFIDFNQNAPHKNVFGAWCVRPRVGAQVSTPFAWDELESIDPESLTMATVPERLEASGDPWADMDDHPQSIAPLVQRFHADLDRGLPDAPWPPVYPKMPDEAPRVAPSRAGRRDGQGRRP